MSEEQSVPSDTEEIKKHVKPNIKMLPLSAFIRGNHRYEGETYEDYRASMKIQNKVHKYIKELGGGHLVGWNPDTNEIHWTTKPNVTRLETAGSRRRFHGGLSRHKHRGDQRRGSIG